MDVSAGFTNARAPEACSRPAADAGFAGRAPAVLLPPTARRVRLLSLAPLAAIALALAGCATAGLGAGTAKPQLPALPKAAVTNVAVPVAHAGDDARAVAAKAIAALRAEQARKAAIVEFYGRLQRGLAGGGK